MLPARKGLNQSYSLKDLFSYSSASISNETKTIPNVFKNSSIEKGVEFFSSPGGEVTYKNIVDLNSIDKKENLVEIVGNSSLDYSDLRKTVIEEKNIHIRVSDAYDSNVYFEVNLSQNPIINQIPIETFGGGHNNLFYSVSFNGYTLANNSDYSPLENYTVAWGQSLFNTPSYLDGSEGKYVPTGFKFDLATNQVLLNLGGAASSSTLDPQNYLLFDLDDPSDAYPDFKGFTTGEVYISIRSEESGKFSVAKIGHDVFSSNDDSLFKKNTGNLLTYGYDFSNMIKGAKSHYYPLPKVLSNSSYDYKVFNGIDELAIEDFNSFIPNTTGNYEVQITSGNAFGFNIEKIGQFVIEESPIAIEDLSNITEIKVKLFQSFNIPFFSYNGGNGKLVKSIKVILDNEVYEVNEGDAFVIEKKCSTAKIKVDVYDEIRVLNTFDYPIFLDYNVKRFYLTDAFETNYVSYGENFKVPNYVAIDYSKDDVSKTNMNIDIKRGQNTYYQPGDLIENVKSDFVLSYLYGNEVLKKVKVLSTSKNIDATTANFSSFYKSNSNVLNSKITNAGMEFTLGDGDATINQPSNVSTSDLTISFCYIKELAHYDCLDIELAGLGNKKITISFKQLGEKPLLYLNNKRIYSSVTVAEFTYLDQDNSYLYGKKYFKYTFVVSGEKASLYNANNHLVSGISNFDDGSKFTGFKFGMAQIKFKIASCCKGDAFFINQISNQQFTTQVLNFGDTRSPYIAFTSSFYNGIYKLGSVVSVPMAYSYDVINSTSSILLSVVAPNGEYLVRNANPFGFDLSLDTYGVYFISYVCEDGNGQTSTFNYRLVVNDDISPSIYTNAKYEEAYEGQVYIYKAIAIDNVDGKVDVIAILRGPDGDSSVVDIGKYATLKLKGNYTLTYFAIDEKGNVATLVYSFISK